MSVKKLSEYKQVHCIGIGGIGLSAIARYCRAQGLSVSGSENSPSPLTEQLQKEGITVYKGHSKDNVPQETDLVIYTIAVGEDNEERVFAKDNGIISMSYPEALGLLTKENTTIAICGTHGKTTTTAMTYYALKECGINPTLIIGSLLTDAGTNFIQGDSEYLIVEACEYKRSFLNLSPTHVIVTNIDEDHLDYYKDIHDIEDAFQSFASKVPHTGTLTTHDDISLTTDGRTFTTKDVDIHSIELSVLGDHNKKNAALVLTLLTALSFDEGMVRKGLQKFPGTWRRTEYKGVTLHGIPVYDDYGHHPSEIQATYKALRTKYKEGEFRIVMFFQPHLHSRTKALLPQFVSVLKDVDELYVLPIYRARLEDTSIISETEVISLINEAGGNAKLLSSLSLIPATIESMTNAKTVIVNMGAGDAYQQLSNITLV
jgi:UDP-N-acetylmuramate--alanine ligase